MILLSSVVVCELFRWPLQKLLLTADCRLELHNQEFCKSNSTPSIVMVVKPNMMCSAGHRPIAPIVENKYWLRKAIGKRLLANEV